MQLNQWLDKYGMLRFQKLANNIGTTKNYLLQVASGHRQASFNLALLIEEHTNCEVMLHELRDDIDYPINTIDNRMQHKFVRSSILIHPDDVNAFSSFLDQLNEKRMRSDKQVLPHSDKIYKN